MPTPLVRMVVDNWPDPVLLIDSEGAIVYASSRAEEVLGYASGALNNIGHAHEHLCANALRSENHSLINCPILSCCTGERWQSCWWQSASGQYLSVDIRTQPIELEDFGRLTVCSFIDNSERRHNQAEFEKFACLVQLNPTAVAEFDVHGQLIFANDAMQSLMVEAGFDEDGLSPVLPRLNTQNLEPEVNKLDDSFSETVQAGESTYQWRLQRFCPEDSEPTLLGYLFDITAEVKHQEALESAKIAARRDFYAKIVHEIRTPLNAIMGFSDLLLKRSSEKLNEREQQNLKAINSAGFQLSEWVTDTLDAAKIDAGQLEIRREVFETCGLIDQFWGQIEALAVTKRLHLSKAVECFEVIADRQKIRQICINLLSNAIKYTPEGEVYFVIRQEVDQWVIEVSDTGPGFTESQRAQLFHSYKMINDSSREGVQGTGLGLVFVKELVAMHRGSIELESQPGDGSTFTVFLPLNLPCEG